MSTQEKQTPLGVVKDDFGLFARLWTKRFNHITPANGHGQQRVFDLTTGDDVSPKTFDMVPDSDEGAEPDSLKSSGLVSGLSERDTSSRPSASLQSNGQSNGQDAQLPPAIRASTPSGEKKALPAESRSVTECLVDPLLKISLLQAELAAFLQNSPVAPSRPNRSPTTYKSRHRPTTKHSPKVLRPSSLSIPVSSSSNRTNSASKSNLVSQDGPSPFRSSLEVEPRANLVSKVFPSRDSESGKDDERQSHISRVRRRRCTANFLSHPPVIAAGTSRRAVDRESEVGKVFSAVPQDITKGSQANGDFVKDIAPKVTNSPVSTTRDDREAPISKEVVILAASQDFNEIRREPDGLTPSTSSVKEQVKDSQEKDPTTDGRPSSKRGSINANERLGPEYRSSSITQGNLRGSLHLFGPIDPRSSASLRPPPIERVLADRSARKSAVAKPEIRSVSAPRVEPYQAVTEAPITAAFDFNVSDLVPSFEKLERMAVKDHERNIKYLLLDAQSVARSFARPNYASEESPFANMESLQSPAGRNVNGQTKVIKLTTRHYKNKNPSRSRAVVPTLSISTTVAGLPSYRGITSVKRALLMCDKKNPDFFPLIGDTDPRKDGEIQDFQKEWERTYNGHIVLRTAVSILEIEKAIWLRPYFTHWLENLNIELDEMRFIHEILKEEEVKPPQLKRQELKALKLKPFEDTYGEQLALAVPTQRGRSSSVGVIAAAFEKALKINLLKVLLPQARINEFVRSINKHKVEQSMSSIHGLETYARLTCMICEVINCPTHGDFYALALVCDESEAGSSDGDSVSTDKEEDYYVGEEFLHDSIVLPYKDLLRRHESRISATKTGTNTAILGPPLSPCSGECYTTSNNVEPGAEWPEEDVVLLESLLKTNDATNRRLPCDLAVALDQLCWQVHQKMLTVKRPEPSIEYTAHSANRGKPLDWYQPAKKAIAKKGFEHTKSVFHEHRAQWKPCAHDGPCMESCPCVMADLPCEVHCGCPDDCIRKFTGCPCASRGQSCVAQSCICVRLARECGPQCSTCGALPRLDPKNRFNDDLFLKGCQNVAIQRNVHKKILIGKSTIEVAGYGLYIAEPAKKGQFLGDYTGELITQDEAERRGCLYDHVSKSFLFTLNDEMIIDAARLGNKTRFINHARDAQHGLNCGASVRFVNGEHRIKFTAERDIAAGEELFFDYGKAFADKHGLNATVPKKKAGAGKKRGIEEVSADEDEERASEGHVNQKKMMREKTQAMLGVDGHAQKARKLAPGLRKAIRRERERSTSKEGLESLDLPLEPEDAVEQIVENESDDPDFAPADEWDEADEERDDETARKRMKRRPVRFRDG